MLLWTTRTSEGTGGDDSTNGEAGRGTSNDDMEDGGSEPEPHFPARTQ